MKKRIAIGIMVVLAVVYFSGPTVTIDMTIHPLELPEDLDEYLKQSEAKYPNIRPGTEKIITWANPSQKNRTPYALVYLHGLGASRQEIAPVTEIVADRIGANVYYTRLRGHGRDADAMGEATVNDWLNDGIEALEIGRKIGEKVVFIATSTGATLATWLATREDTENILAFVLISPNYGPQARFAEVALLPWGNVIIRLAIGKYRSYEPQNKQMAQYWTTTQDSRIILTVMGFVDLISQSDFSKFKTRVMMIFSDKDRVIRTDRIYENFEKIEAGYKRKFIINNSACTWNHIIAGDIVSPNTTSIAVQAIMDFLDPLLDKHHNH